MTREQRWIRARQRELERGIELATRIKGALGPNPFRRYRRELATIKAISVIVDVYAAGLSVRSRLARTASESQPRRRRQGVDKRKSARGTVHGPRR